jgi:hypothetical protein
MNIIRTGAMSVAATVCFVMLPSSASAQTLSPVQGSSGPMVVERIKSGALIAPDFRITEFDGKAAGLFGAYGGWLSDQSLLIGAGGYWLGGASANEDMWYFGLVTGWFAHADKPIGFGIKGLVGFGEATLTNGFNTLPPPRPSPFSPYYPGYPVYGYSYYHEDFFIFDPDASVSARLSKNVRLTGSVGYRLTAGAYGPDDRLHGITGGVSLQIGNGF